MITSLFFQFPLQLKRRVLYNSIDSLSISIILAFLKASLVTHAKLRLNPDKTLLLGNFSLFPGYRSNVKLVFVVIIPFFYNSNQYN